MSDRLAWTLLGLLLVACTNSPKSTDGTRSPSEPTPFYEGTDAMRASIDDILTRLPETEGAERLKLAERLVAYGEPALPRLIETLHHEDPAMRTLAAWLLGRRKDPRTLDALDGALSDGNEGVRYEAATALVRAGDARGMQPLVDGLVHSDPRVRSRSIKVLEQVTGETFAYRADDHPHERRAAVARWTAWLAERQAPPGS